MVLCLRGVLAILHWMSHCDDCAAVSLLGAPWHRNECNDAWAALGSAGAPERSEGMNPAGFL